MADLIKLNGAAVSAARLLKELAQPDGPPVEGIRSRS